MKLMEGREIPPQPGGDPRVAILGPLEARLQRRDLMILGGLNEGVWPASIAEDPFLSRAMRNKLGLPSLDARMGLAAHDFAQLANAPEIVLSRALKREGSPTLASRWLWRLETLARGAGAPLARAEAPLAWARALDAEPRNPNPRVPRPKPPANARLRRISVTRVETLIRDPYAIYAERILRLKVLEPVGAEAGARERGNAIHKAIERFADGRDPELLAALLQEELRDQGFPEERLAAERARLASSIKALLAWLEERRAQGGESFRERPAQLLLQCGVTLSGKADHIEVEPEGATILDFKTGAPPTKSQVETGLAPQMPLEAAMLVRGAFDGVPRARASELVYWRIGGADPRPLALKLEASAHETGEKALKALEALLQRYGSAEQPFLSKPRVQFIKPYDDYDLLARRKEWADAEGEE
jgi:ATP-dependent helicase/nuclease subunit B